MRDGGPERPRCDAGYPQRRRARLVESGPADGRRGRQSGLSSRFGAAFVESGDSLRVAAGRDSGSSVCEAETSAGLGAGVEATACGRAAAGVDAGIAAGAEAAGAEAVGAGTGFGVEAGAVDEAGAVLAGAGVGLEAGVGADVDAATGDGIEATGVGARTGVSAAG